MKTHSFEIEAPSFDVAFERAKAYARNHIDVTEEPHAVLRFVDCKTVVSRWRGDEVTVFSYALDFT